MSLTKEIIRWQTNKSISKISSAKEACANAGQTLFSPEEDVSQYWKGEAGAAMVQELHEVGERIKAARELLSTAETQVRSCANYIVNNWTEEEGGEE